VSAPEPPFLTADWLNLALLNYEIDPSQLEARVPAGCELDTWSGRTLVSVVGFMFHRTLVLGVAIPFHRSFEEVNLRFYVRRKCDGAWRRGVVFIKELVPRPAIAFVARTVYGENYVALPMRHQVTLDAGTRRLAYQWRRSGRWEGLAVAFSGTPEVPAEDSEEAFITEHYWGYSRQSNGATMEYQVEHPRWAVREANEASLSCDVATLYGPAFVAALAGRPRTAFVATGSTVLVRRGRRLGAGS